MKLFFLVFILPGPPLEINDIKMVSSVACKNKAIFYEQFLIEDAKVQCVSLNAPIKI
jgi:hypothetical protein